MDLRAPSKALSGWVAARLIAEGSGTCPVIALPGPVDASPLGMGPLRLEMSLRQRIAAVAAKREERDRRFLHLRRKYIHELRNYILENKVSTLSWVCVSSIMLAIVTIDMCRSNHKH